MAWVTLRACVQSDFFFWWRSAMTLSILDCFLPDRCANALAIVLSDAHCLPHGLRRAKPSSAAHKLAIPTCITTYTSVKKLLASSLTAAGRIPGFRFSHASSACACAGVLALCSLRIHGAISPGALPVAYAGCSVWGKWSWTRFERCVPVSSHRLAPPILDT